MKRGAALLAGLLFAVVVYRAWTQSITHDEALTWRMYIITPLSSLTLTYDANHHILHTWLARLITTLLGVSTFTIRLPALFGSALYLWMLVRLGGLLFGRTWLAPATVVLLGAAPMLMDFQVAARGYGLALALFLLALERLTSAMLAEPRRKDLWVAGAAMGLSIGSNMVFILPVTAALALFLYLWRPPAAKLDSPKQELPAAPRAVKRNDLFIAFGAAMLLFFVLAPVKHMLKRDLYYVGQKTLELSLTDLGANTLAHNEGVARLNTLVLDHPAVKRTFGMGVYPAILLVGLMVGWRMRSQTDPAGRGMVLFYYSSIAIGSWVLILALHLVTGFPFPTDRTGIHLLPMFLLVLLNLAACERLALKLGAGALIATLAVSFAVQFQTTHFRIWRYNAETRVLVEEMHRRGTQPGRPRTVGITWLLQPAVDFYQATLDLKSFNYAVHEEMRPGLDEYWLATEDWGLIEKYKLRTVRAMSVSQLIIAEPSGGR
jgi:hypothetical protein